MSHSTISEPRTPTNWLPTPFADETPDDGTADIDEDEPVVLPTNQEAEVLVAWIKDFKYSVKYTKFHGVLVHILNNLVAGCTSELPMNDLCLWYLQQCCGICDDVARVICSYVPQAVQAALDVDIWSVLELLHDTESYKVKRKGHYFVAAMEDSSYANLVTYVGAAIGFRGLHQRCPDHLDPGSRGAEKEKGKWLYRLILGGVDGIERPIVRAAALVIFPEDTSSIPQLGAFSDVIEGAFAIALRTLRTIRPDPRYELHLYAAMAPDFFQPKIAALGANAITPVSVFF
jgi:hypothetical protein